MSGTIGGLRPFGDPRNGDPRKVIAAVPIHGEAIGELRAPGNVLAFLDNGEVWLGTVLLPVQGETLRGPDAPIPGGVAWQRVDSIPGTEVEDPPRFRPGGAR